MKLKAFLLSGMFALPFVTLSSPVFSGCLGICPSGSICNCNDCQSGGCCCQQSLPEIQKLKPLPEGSIIKCEGNLTPVPWTPTDEEKDSGLLMKLKDSVIYQCPKKENNKLNPS